MTSKRMTIADIAKLSGTSTATVSHFLNGKFEKMSEATRQRIEKIVAETGYSPNAHAQGLAGGSSGVIAILIEDNTNIWAGQVVRGIERPAHENGYLTVICDTHFDHKVERNYVEKMLSIGVDGFVIQPTKHYRSLNERLRRAGKPVVFYDFSLVDLNSTWVKTDLYGGVYDAISACLERGYEECVLLAAELDGARTRAERYQGMSDALAERGVSSRTIAVAHDTPSVPELRRQLELRINPARRTLIFCPHQWALARVYKALEPMRHLIPERIGLLGMNNTDWTDLTNPTVSTIVEPVEREGELACSLLIDLIRDPSCPPRQQMLSCETRWLSSTL